MWVLIGWIILRRGVGERDGDVGKDEKAEKGGALGALHGNSKQMF